MLWPSSAKSLLSFPYWIGQSPLRARSSRISAMVSWAASYSDVPRLTTSPSSDSTGRQSSEIELARGFDCGPCDPTRNEFSVTPKGYGKMAAGTIHIVFIQPITEAGHHQIA